MAIPDRHRHHRQALIAEFADGIRALPRVALGVWPTPVRLLPLHGLPLWVKDEGAAASPYGGNKVRKLEWLLAEAATRGRRDLLTFGAVGSHHVLATSLYGATLGMCTHAVLFPQPDTPHARANAERLHAWGASLTPTSGLSTLPGALAMIWGRLMARGRRPYRIFAGGSTPVGTIGWLEAGLEIAHDVAVGRLPEPSRVYVALGSGGTAAGLLAGLRLAGLRSEVVAVRVTGREVANGTHVRWLGRGAVAELRRRGIAVREPAWGGLRIAHGAYGDGYGTASEAAEAAITEAADHGLVLERTYTGRALACCLAENALDPRPSLFVQTVHAGALPGSRTVLPPALEALLRRVA